MFSILNTETQLIRLIKKFVETGVDRTEGEFDAQRVRTLNVALLMMLAVALVSLPAMVLVGREETVPGTTVFLALTSFTTWLQFRGRADLAALSMIVTGLLIVGAQSYFLGRDYGVHFWLLPLILFPVLFFSRGSRYIPPLLGTLIAAAFIWFAAREQTLLGHTDDSVTTQALAVLLVLGLSITMRRLLLRAETGHEDYRLRVESQANQLRKHQTQLEAALADAEGIRRVLDLRVGERTLELQTAHDQLSQELVERTLIEEQRQVLEAELQHAQRLESIGQLAGGVAHDFNNLLTVIAGNVEIVLESPDSMSETQLLCLDDVRAATDRAASVAGQLLAYSRKQAVVLETLDPHRAVEGVRRMIERAAGELIHVEFETLGSVGTVRVGRGQIEQVLMNLALNACDAMPQGGTLRIELTELPTLPSSISKSDASAKPHVLLRVSDTGSGMDETTRSHVFEPFFTTKDQGKGTGLGLSVVHGIVTQHKGFLDVESSLGTGSRFSVYLPVVTGTPATSPGVEATSATKSGQGKTILIIEDEPAVRRVTSGLLKGKGYTVLIAESGDDALEIAANYSGDVDLILTDVVMPGLQGPELVASLLELYPRAAVLFVSGYMDPDRFGDLNLNERRSFLQKPFSTESLEHEVSEILNRPTA